ncbi:hypothetical protein KY362_02810 [Candidatus Woesearchaeota archaeon]|nr:hypothetical protein [Candidatus Woesearchaeota archaeon]
MVAETELETKTQVTRKFMIGVGFIIGSLVMGKAVLIPLILFPGNKQVSITMLVLYITTWPIMLTGIWLAGVEGYRLATHKYREVQRKTISHVKEGSRKAAHHVKEGSRKAAHHVKEGSRKAANHTKNAARKTVEKVKRPVKRSERVFRNVKAKRIRGL